MGEKRDSELQVISRSIEYNLEKSLTKKWIIDRGEKERISEATKLRETNIRTIISEKWCN